MALIPDSAVSIINNVVGSPNLITGEIEYSSYGYNIKLGTSAFFTAAFALVTLVHLVQAGLSRRWFLFYTLCLGAGLEAGGWGGRLASAASTAWEPSYGGIWDSDPNAFMAQICMLILAPAFEMAANYVLLGVLIRNLGQQYSKLDPKTYVWIFCSGDLLSLIIQGAGGGIAASANTLSGANTGGYIMAGGVIFQMVIMCCFTYLLVEFTFRYLKDRPTKQFYPFACFSRRRKTSADVSSGASAQTAVDFESRHVPIKRNAELMLLGIAISTFFVFIRSVYRCPELLSGWNGPIIENQTLFDVLDGAMILVSMIALNVLHPVWLVPRGPAQRKSSAPSTDFVEMKQARSV